MKQRDIKEGESYLFIATESPDRKHLEGTKFTVWRIEPVFRRFKGKGTRRVMRNFNEDGVGARAEELEPLPVCWCCGRDVDPGTECTACERHVCEDCTVKDKHPQDHRRLCRRCDDLPF